MEAFTFLLCHTLALHKRNGLTVTSAKAHGYKVRTGYKNTVHQGSKSKGRKKCQSHFLNVVKQAKVTIVYVREINVKEKEASKCNTGKLKANINTRNSVDVPPASSLVSESGNLECQPGGGGVYFSYLRSRVLNMRFFWRSISCGFVKSLCRICMKNGVKEKEKTSSK